MMGNFMCILLKFKHTHIPLSLSCPQQEGVQVFRADWYVSTGQNGGMSNPGLVSKAWRATAGASPPYP